MGFALWPVDGDLLAPCRAVVGEEAEDGVLLRVLYSYHVHRHVCDVDGVLLLPFLCGGAWTGVVVYPWSPCPMMLCRLRLRDARYSLGPLLALWVGWWRCRAFDNCVQGARSRAGGRGGGGRSAGSPCGRGPRGCLP